MADSWESQLLRNNKDLPKELRDVDSILTRTESFWRGHGLKDITRDVGNITSKGMHIKNTRHFSGVDIPFEGGISMDDAERALIKVANDKSLDSTLSNNAYAATQILRPVTISRSSEGPANPVWGEHASALRDRINESRTDFPGINPSDMLRDARKVIDLPNSVHERRLQHVRAEAPHVLSGQFLNVSINGLSDVINLGTGSWARLNKDRTGYDVL
jgi:hypothetical protein